VLTLYGYSTYLPSLCPRGPNILVPNKYDILAGRKAAPETMANITIVALIIYTGTSRLNTCVAVLVSILTTQTEHNIVKYI
jgi:hypothetical protein